MNKNTIKSGFLMQKTNIVMAMLFLFVAMICALFIFMAYNTVENMKSSAIGYYEQQQMLIAKQTANSIETYMEFLIADALVTSRHPDLSSKDHEKIVGVLERMYERIAPTSKGIVLTRVDKKGMLLAKYEELPGNREKGIGVHFSNFTGFDSDDVIEVMKTHQRRISKPVVTPCGHRAVTLLFPIFDQDEFDGVLRVTLFIDETLLENFIAPIHFADTGHVHLIMDGMEFSHASDTIEKEQSFQTFENQDIIEKINNEEYGILRHNYKHITGVQETGETVVAAYHPARVLDKKWGLIVEMPEDEAYSSIENNLNKIWYSAFGIIISVIVSAMVIFFLLTKTLRKEIKEKTEELESVNFRLEDIVKNRTQELEKKSRELEMFSLNLVSQVEKKTKEIAKKLKKEEKTSKAMLYILERQKKTNTELLDAKNQLKKEKQNVEKKVVDRTKELEEEKEHVELLLEEKNQFVNQLSHDLRTPISPMLILLPIAIKHSKDKDTRYDLEVILKNVKYLNSLVDNTLNLARLQGNTMKFDIKTIDILQIVEEVMETNKTAYKQNNVVAVNNIKDRVFVLCDRLRVREIIENIQMNSVKFMSGGGTITFGAEKNKKEVIISISDTGIGIEKEKLEKIFEEFYKADESRHNLGGTGLGLSICKRMLKKMHGRIWVKSDGLNKGTTICFALPLGKRPDDKSVL